MTKPTFGSLFAGIGGIDLGLERAGWEGRWQVEYDPYCTRVLAKHWPDVARYGDIHDVGGHNLPYVDLLAGGFPCQPFSNAGKRQGKDDVRWLWPEFARVIGDLRPRYVLVENVPGLLAGHGGMGAVLGDLASLGYDAEWDSIPASAVGAPHLRYRVWIIGRAKLGRDVADADDGRSFDSISAGRDASWDGGTNDLADALRERRRGRHDQRQHAADADPPGQGVGPGGYGEWWATEPDVGRVANGVPARVDRLRALGNAVVPQVVEMIGRRILETEAVA